MKYDEDEFPADERSSGSLGAFFSSQTQGDLWQTATKMRYGYDFPVDDVTGDLGTCHNSQSLANLRQMATMKHDEDDDCPSDEETASMSANSSQSSDDSREECTSTIDTADEIPLTSTIDTADEIPLTLTELQMFNEAVERIRSMDNNKVPHTEQTPVLNCPDTISCQTEETPKRHQQPFETNDATVAVSTSSPPQPRRRSCEITRQDCQRKLVLGRREMLHLQGEKPGNNSLTDSDAGEHVAEMVYLLRAHFTLRQPGVDPYIPFEASDAVESLTSLGLGANRREAAAQCSLLVKGGFLVPASSFGQGRIGNFEDGPDLYRFADRQELKESLDSLDSNDLLVEAEDSEKRMLLVALQATLEMPEASLDGSSMSDSIILRAFMASLGEDKEKVVQRVMRSIKIMVGIDQLSSCDLLRLMTWTRDFKSGDYIQHSEKDLKQEEQYHAESDKLITLLMVEYRKRIMTQIQRWLTQASWERSVDLSRNSEGHVVTSDPEDMLFAINVQMSVVQESLPQSCCIDVMIDVLLEFKRAQLRTREALSESWKDLDMEWLCSVVNDSVSLLEYCEDLEIFGLMKKGFIPTFELKMVKDDITRGYMDLAIEATDIIANSVMRDLHEPVLSQIFSPRWELEQDLVHVIIATLRDYYGDLSVWLPKYEFSRVVKKCVLLLLEGYMKGAFSQDARVPFLNAATVSGHLLKDRLILLDFFSSLEVEMGHFGGKQQAEDSFETLRAMATIVVSTDPKAVVDETYNLCRVLGQGYGQAAAMFLVRKAGSLDHHHLQTWENVLCSSLEEDLEATTKARMQCSLTPLLKPKPKISHSDDSVDWTNYDDGHDIAGGDIFVRTEPFENRDDFAASRSDRDGFAGSYVHSSRAARASVPLFGRKLMKSFRRHALDAQARQFIRRSPSWSKQQRS